MHAELTALSGVDAVRINLATKLVTAWGAERAAIGRAEGGAVSR